jgi:hypothetical protein
MLALRDLGDHRVRPPRPNRIFDIYLLFNVRFARDGPILAASV